MTNEGVSIILNYLIRPTEKQCVTVFVQNEEYADMVAF